MNAASNKKFLDTITVEAKTQILGSIARHYGATPDEIYDEVTQGEAEHLLDYMTGAERAATSALMQKHGFR